MNCCICERNFGLVGFLGGNSTVSEIRSDIFWGCMPYLICSVPWLVLCTIWILREVPMMIYCLAYFGLLLLFLMGITVCGCNLILQICACRLIGGDELLIVWAYLDLSLPAVVIFPMIGGGSLYLWFIFPLWRYFWKSVCISLNFSPCDYLGWPTGTWCPWLSLPF